MFQHFLIFCSAKKFLWEIQTLEIGPKKSLIFDKKNSDETSVNFLNTVYSLHTHTITQIMPTQTRGNDE